MLRRCIFIACMLLALCLFFVPAHAEEDSLWWASAENEAVRDGYKLINTKDLADLMVSDRTPLILDARADYEFEAGHIPGSVNLEFDLGDRTDLSLHKKQALEGIVGSDKKRLLVLYCRSFR